MQNSEANFVCHFNSPTIAEAERVMKNIISTFAMLGVFALIGLGIWYAIKLADPEVLRVEPLNAKQEIPGMLAPEKQKELWDLEHMAWQIENRFGKTYMDAWKSRDAEKIVSLISAEFEGTRPDIEFVTLTKANVTQKSRDTEFDETKTATTLVIDEHLDYLFQPGNEIDFDFVDLKVTEIKEVGKNRWRTTFVVNGQGMNTAGKPAAYESSHTLILDCANGDKLDTDPSILQWDVTRETWRVAESTLMKDVTGDVGLKDLILTDNWVNRHTKEYYDTVRQHQVQTAVEDFDRDGDLDLALATLEGHSRLFRNDDGVFKDVTEEMGLKVEIDLNSQTYSNFGCAWLDFDNDNYPDLLMGAVVYQNKQGKKFKARTDMGFYQDCLPMGVSLADVNNDGFVDVYTVYKAKGTGFQRKTDDHPLIRMTGTNLTKTNLLFMNVEGKSFENKTFLTDAAGPTHRGHSSAWMYLNDDLLPDLCITQDMAANVMLSNLDNGEFFKDISSESGFAIYGDSTGVAVGDVNNDNEMDVLVGNIGSNIGKRLISHIEANDYDAETYGKVSTAANGNQLMLKVPGKPEFKLSDASPISDSGWCWGSAFFDLESDGWEDLYCANGFMSVPASWEDNAQDREAPDLESCYWRCFVTMPTDMTLGFPQIGPLDEEAGELWSENPFSCVEENINMAAYQRNKLYLNVEGEFIDASFASGADIDADSRSVIRGDFNQDGKPDLLVGNSGGQTVRLFHNQAPQGNRLIVRLQGTDANSLGIGARISAEFGGRKVVRDLFQQNSFMGLGPAEVWFGMGDADQIDKLTIRWPGGETQTLTEVNSNRCIRIEQGKQEIQTIYEFE